MCETKKPFSFWFRMDSKHNCFSQFLGEKRLCFAPIRSTSDGATILHLTVFFISIYFYSNYDTLSIQLPGTATIPAFSKTW